MQNDWLQRLKVGDDVGVMPRGYGRNTPTLQKVTRVTDTLIIIESMKFRRKNGEQAGHRGVWDTPPYLIEATPKAKVEWAASGHENKLRGWARTFDFYRILSVSQLERIKAIAEEKGGS